MESNNRFLHLLQHSRCSAPMVTSFALAHRYYTMNNLPYHTKCLGVIASPSRRTYLLWLCEKTSCLAEISSERFLYHEVLKFNGSSTVTSEKVAPVTFGSRSFFPVIFSHPLTVMVDPRKVQNHVRTHVFEWRPNSNETGLLSRSSQQHMISEPENPFYRVTRTTSYHDYHRSTSKKDLNVFFCLYCMVPV